MPACNFIVKPEALCGNRGLSGEPGRCRRRLGNRACLGYHPRRRHRRMTSEDLVTSREGRAARVLLNRPKALNALTLPMIRTCTRGLNEWAKDPHIHAVVIAGAGDR